MFYDVRLAVARSNNIREKTLPKGQSKAIVINDCPFCQFSRKCKEYQHADGEGHLLQMCLLRSWELEYVWLSIGDDRAKVNIGDRFGKLVVKNFRTYDDHGHPLWVCQCDCGNHKTARGADLLGGKTKSCGCLRGGDIEYLKIKWMFDYIFGVRRTENVGLSKEKWRYTRGSGTNPDGTTHQFINGHEGNVGKSVCHVVEIIDDNGELHRHLENTKCDCGGQIRIDEHGDQLCDICNYMNG